MTSRTQHEDQPFIPHTLLVIGFIIWTIFSDDEGQTDGMKEKPQYYILVGKEEYYQIIYIFKERLHNCEHQDLMFTLL